MSRKIAGRAKILFLQIIVVGLFLAAWELLPRLDWLSARTHLLDPYFISSPSRIVSALGDLITGHGGVEISDYIVPTLVSAGLGAAIGMALGAAFGLLFSNFDLLSDVFRPIVVALNAVPRIALIPIVVILAGPTMTTSTIVSVMVVFFLAFFNALEGGRSVPMHVRHNAALLGASRYQVMRHIRLPYVFAWTMAALPLAVTFSLLAAVTTELFTSYPGLGRLLSQSSATADTTLTFAVVVVLALIGIVVVALAEKAEHRILHWWGR